MLAAWAAFLRDEVVDPADLAGGADAAEVVHAALRVVVARTLAEREPGLAVAFAETVVAMDEEHAELADLDLDELWEIELSGDTVVAAVRGSLAGCLERARRRAGAVADLLAVDVLTWVHDHLGVAGPALEHQAARLGGPGASTPFDPSDRPRHHQVVVLVWLVTGLIAVRGGEDPRRPQDPEGGGA